MAERITTARPYAKAIFALARKNNSLGNTSTGLQRAATVVADPQVHTLLGSPHVTPAQLAGLVNDVAGLDENGRDFVSLLAHPEVVDRHPTLKRIGSKVRSIICGGGSDSANLDDMLIALIAGGLSLPQGLIALLPESPKAAAAGASSTR